MDWIDVGIGAGLVALLVLCAIGVYLHLYNFFRIKERDMVRRQSHALESMRLARIQLDATRTSYDEEDKKMVYWHLRTAKSIISSASQWLK